MDTDYVCSFCGTVNTTWVDPSQGEEQRYVEDCQICCRPNVLQVFWDPEEEVFIIQAEPES
jgi:hypothetical protein